MRAAALSLLLLGVAGCGAPREFVRGVDAGWSVIEPEYAAYVSADAALTQDQKERRLRTAAALRRLIEAGKGE